MAKASSAFGFTPKSRRRTEPGGQTGAALFSPLIILPLRANQRKPFREQRRHFRTSGAVYLSAVLARGAAPYGAVSQQTDLSRHKPAPLSQGDTSVYGIVEKWLVIYRVLRRFSSRPPPPPQSPPQAPPEASQLFFFPAWMEERIRG